MAETSSWLAKDCELSGVVSEAIAEISLLLRAGRETVGALAVLLTRPMVN